MSQNPLLKHFLEGAKGAFNWLVTTLELIYAQLMGQVNLLLGVLGTNAPWWRQILALLILLSTIYLSYLWYLNPPLLGAFRSGLRWVGDLLGIVVSVIFYGICLSIIFQIAFSVLNWNFAAWKWPF